MTPGLDHAAALHAAAAQAGVDTEGAEIIKIGDNALYRLPHQIVARVSRPGRTAAFKEVAVARWLARLDIPAVRVLDELDQPIQIDDRYVTFWQELSPHCWATTGQVAAALRLLHSLPLPHDVTLPSFDPFVGLSEHLDAAANIDRSERSWLTHHLATVHESYDQVEGNRERARVLHGDAHGENIIVVSGRGRHKISCC